VKFFKTFFGNKVVGFLLSKYLAFGFQLINSMLIAKYLGLYFFGIYGLVTLILQYLNYSSFGIYNSYQIIFASEKKMSELDQQKLTGNAFFSLLGVSILLIIASIPMLFCRSLNVFGKYDFKEFILPIFTIGILVHFNTLYIAIYRLFGKISIMNIYSLILPAFQLVVLLIFKGKELLYSLVFAMLFANFAALLLFVFYSPVKVKLFRYLEMALIVKLFKRGFFLLCYNLSFFGIIITARTMVGFFYSIEDFALFNFSNSISQAIFLLLGSLNFLFYPKLINVISQKADMKEVIEFIEKIRKFYLTLTLLIILFSLLVMPILFIYLPNYKKSLISLQLLMLGQLLIDNSYGYSTLLIQRSKENWLTIIGCFAVLLVALFSILFHYFKLPFESVSMAVVLAVLFYNFFVIYYGNKITKQFDTFFSLLKYVYKIELFAPVLLYFVLSFFINENYIIFILTMILYLLLNHKDLKDIIKESFKMLTNGELLKITS
jgi:O-antigen/teichoic acid export membrane protein